MVAAAAIGAVRRRRVATMAITARKVVIIHKAVVRAERHMAAAVVSRKEAVDRRVVQGCPSCESGTCHP